MSFHNTRQLKTKASDAGGAQKVVNMASQYVQHAGLLLDQVSACVEKSPGGKSGLVAALAELDASLPQEVVDACGSAVTLWNAHAEDNQKTAPLVQDDLS